MKTSVSEIIINEKYRLSPLSSVRQDNLSAFFGNLRIAYVCNYPDKHWHNSMGLPMQKNASLNKKRSMMNVLPAGSKMISPTGVGRSGCLQTHQFFDGVEHLGSKYRFLLPPQLALGWALFKWLIRHKRDYDTIFNYGCYPYTLFPCLAAKTLLNKDLLLDYEDDYSAKARKWSPRWMYYRIAPRLTDGAVCIHDSMQRYFRNKRTCVFNCFGDFNYLRTINTEMHSGMKLLFSSHLDDIRGGDLLPELTKALRNEFNNFQIHVTGRGPLFERLKNKNDPNIIMHGFLNQTAYDDLLESVSGCLVLQKPDHPFSSGSYPSKIQDYARHRKPIYIIRLINNS